MDAIEMAIARCSLPTMFPQYRWSGDLPAMTFGIPWNGAAIRDLAPSLDANTDGNTPMVC